MRKDVFTFMVAGKAGGGVRKAGSVAAHLFADMERSVFEYDDYPSVIKGGTSFSVVSSAPQEVTSHYMKANLLVAQDARSYNVHRDDLTERGLIVFNSDEVQNGKGTGIPMSSEAKKYPDPDIMLGVGSVAVLACAVGMEMEALENLIEREYSREIENNTTFARTIYTIAYPHLGNCFPLERGDKKRTILTGNEACGLGAVAGGLDVYIAYPMTPVSALLHYLAAHDRELGIVVIHPENELAVVNMGIGAVYAGAKTMVGSSGGGTALMEEAYSLAGMTETPILFVLGTRCGPSTGAPTYTEQADLRFVLNQGHGDFPRIVAAPGSVEEAFYVAAEMLTLVWQFQTPGTVLMDRHLCESSKTVDLHPEKAAWAQPVLHTSGEYKRYKDTENGISPLLFPPSEETVKWNSYEHDELGITTDNAEGIVKMHDKRLRKLFALREHMKHLNTVNTYGDGEVTIFTYGSTTMSVLEALRAGDIEASVVQPVYLEPFPVWELERHERGRMITVEQSSTGQFAALLKSEGFDSHVIKKYDGRPFDPELLASQIKEVITRI